MPFGRLSFNNCSGRETVAYICKAGGILLKEYHEISFFRNMEGLS